MGADGEMTLKRKIIMPVALLAAFVTAMLCGSGEEGTRESSVGRSAPGLHDSSHVSAGLESASWRTPGAAAAPEEDLEPDYIDTSPDPVAYDTRKADIPDEVRERLARTYVGLDIALARPRPDEEAQVRR